MKRTITIIMAVLLMALSSEAFAQKKSKNAGLEEVTFVTNMHCKNCEKKCDANLPFEKGVKDYKTDLESKTIYFKFDSKKTSKEKLAKAIEKLGYTAEEVQTVKKRK